MSKAQDIKKDIPVWPNGTLESNGITDPETVKNNVSAFGKTINGLISNISEASFTVYSPSAQKNTGVALIICPGGAYRVEASENEGSLMAEWLVENGITGILLKYRLPNGHPDIPLKDAKETLRLVRKNALKWGINPDKIGISGYSAGGHLASLLLTQFDKSSRPDFGVLCYPLISLESSNENFKGLRKIFLGAQSEDVNAIQQYSSNLQVRTDTPSTILFHSDDDPAISSENSILFYQALKKNQVKSSLHIFPEGGHGWGFTNDFIYHEELKTLILDWLKQ